MTEQTPHTEVKEPVNLWYAYQTIKELPVVRWFEILSTGHLHHLYKSGTGSVNKKLQDLWIDLQQQYFDEFGIDDNFQIRLVKMKKLVELTCDFIITGDRYLLNQINQLNFELKENGEDITVSHYKIKSQIEKYRKYPIDFKNTTVIEWGWLVKDYQEAGREAKAAEVRQKFKGRG